MVLPARLHAHAFADYLDLEAGSNLKHEYLDGEIYAMAGGSPRHAALTLAVGGALLAGLRGGLYWLGEPLPIGGDTARRVRG